MRKILIAILVITFGMQTPFPAGAVLLPLALEEHNKRVAAGGGGYLIPEAELEAYRKLYNDKLLPWSQTPAVFPESRKLTSEEQQLEEEVGKKYYNLTPEQLAIYKNLSKELCLNILLGEGQGVIYNGEYLQEYLTSGITSHIDIESIRIAGDRLGYRKYIVNDPLFTQYGPPIIVDGQEMGRGSFLVLSEDHTAYLRQTVLDPTSGEEQPRFNLIFDGKDLGPTGWSGAVVRNLLRINGGRVLYVSYDENVPYAERKLSVFMDGKRVEQVGNVRLGEGREIDFDGKNLAVIDWVPVPGSDYGTYRAIYNGSVVYSAKRKWVLTDLVLKDGHWKFEDLLTPATGRTFYDGKVTEYDGVVLGDEGRLAYWKDGNLFFEGKNYGSHAGTPSLAGDHIAFIDFSLKADVSGSQQRLVNIDGKQYRMGNLWAGVLINEKSNCIAQGALLRAKGDTDVWVVKHIGGKKFKRLILSPHVFESYGHLKWRNVKEVEQSVLNDYITSDLVRADGDAKVYRLFPQGDTGTKRWIPTQERFLQEGFDWDAVYTINSVDRDAYSTGEAYQ